MIGPIDIALESVCEMDSRSELYEVAALCNVRKCNIRSVFPNFSTVHDLEAFNSVLTPATSIITNCNIALLWCNTYNEREVTAANNGNWSPNHFVPLLLANNQNELNYSNQSKSILSVNQL